jgi:Fe2+ or Zn2+ uptake regulation protein
MLNWPLEMNGVAPIRQLLKSHGLRYSRPREVILSFFKAKDQHLTAEALYQQLKERGEDLSLSTVYLNLNVLREAGLIREFSSTHGEAVYDSNVSPHAHLICKQCQAIRDLPLDLIAGLTPSHYLKTKAEQDSGWLIDEPELICSGLCPACSKAHHVVTT